MVSLFSLFTLRIVCTSPNLSSHTKVEGSRKIA